jgi:hypothetical protein
MKSLRWRLRHLRPRSALTTVFTSTDSLLCDLLTNQKARLKQWSTTQDGQRLVSKLKGTVKTIHSDFQKGAPSIVLATHQSLEELLMTHAEMQASQTARIANLVEDVTALDVAIQVSDSKT